MDRRTPIKVRGLVIGSARSDVTRFCERRRPYLGRREMIRRAVIRMAREAVALAVAAKNEWN